MRLPSERRSVQTLARGPPATQPVSVSTRRSCPISTLQIEREARL